MGPSQLRACATLCETAAEDGSLAAVVRANECADVMHGLAPQTPSVPFPTGTDTAMSGFPGPAPVPAPAPAPEIRTHLPPVCVDIVPGLAMVKAAVADIVSVSLKEYETHLVTKRMEVAARDGALVNAARACFRLRALGDGEPTNRASARIAECLDLCPPFHDGQLHSRGCFHIWTVQGR